ncbi:hypothetical protein [Nonomuraea sp. SBT364]|uniref:hypothetical protein n=1 Tax=Nonomuraea sp. SBT364 TaxID=1580530 RepID=UPI00066A3EE4|nr:hypothetical protein [Nonomuraea sp. SBT364]
MTVFEPIHHEPPPLPLPIEGEHPVAHLRRCVERAIARADQLAAAGGHEREEADRHMAQARRYDDAAVAARRRVETWTRLIEVAEAEQANRPAGAAPYPAAAIGPAPTS